MVVTDMETTLQFYRACFPHWEIRTKGNADWHGTKRNWLHFGDDYHYLSLNDMGTGEPRDLSSNEVGLAHLGFEVDKLSALRKRMQEAGFEPSSLGAEHEFRRNLYYIDPNGLEVEFVEYSSDAPNERNSSQA
ncbi:MAG: catechol-2,3-dioxygenase [Alphaproteobacteria bacterium]|jgi:catechol-2,3-dioxygenase